MTTAVRSRVFVRTWALPSPHANGRARWLNRTSVLCALDDGDGNVGLGEAAPLEQFSIDAASGAHLALARAAARLPGLVAPTLRPELSHSAIVRTCATIASSLDRIGLEAATHPSARSAVECAWLDLLSRRAGIPLHAYLAPLAARPRINDDAMAGGTIALDACALIDTTVPLHALAHAAQQLASQGFGTVKLKVGRAGVSWDDEWRAVEGVHRAVPELSLRLDANGVWDVPTARKRLDARVRVPIEFVEEPTCGAGLLSVGRTYLRWAVDESLRDDEVVRRILESPGLAAIVLKPTLLGGPLRAMDLATRAAKFGVASVVSHAFEGPVAFALSCELALALGRQPYAAGLAPHDGLRAWSGTAVEQVARRTSVHALREHGLGFSADHTRALDG